MLLARQEAGRDVRTPCCRMSACGSKSDIDACTGRGHRASGCICHAKTKEFSSSRIAVGVNKGSGGCKTRRPSIARQGLLLHTLTGCFIPHHAFHFFAVGLCCGRVFGECRNGKRNRKTQRDKCKNALHAATPMKFSVNTRLCLAGQNEPREWVALVA